MVKRMKLKNIGAGKVSNDFLNLGKIFLSVLLVLSSVGTGPVWAKSKHKTIPQKVVTVPQVPLSTKEILKQSQISYQAEGGFSGIRSYGVHISCVGGKISTLCSIIDPRITKSDIKPIYRKGTMDIDTYLALWKKMNNMAVFRKKDAPNPKQDILDEFTLNFTVQAGENKNSFRVYGLSRPEAAQYYALRTLIDHSAQMTALWNFHKSLASQPSYVRYSD
jgi:hypothetical protein